MKEMWKSLLELRPQFADIKFTKIKCVSDDLQSISSASWGSPDLVIFIYCRKTTLLSTKLVELEDLITQRRKIKIGILRALGGQTVDDDMFSNRSSRSRSSNFNAYLFRILIHVAIKQSHLRI
jgi:hypothetical protein